MKMRTSRINLLPLPEPVARTLNDYFGEPIKVADDDTKTDLRLSSPTLGEARVLAQLILAVSPKASLEIGFGNAGSTVAIAAARKHLGLEIKHVALDPYQVDHFHSVGLSELAKCGLRDHVDWLPERSESFLHAATLREDKYDFIFIDGGHDIGQTVTDAFFTHRTLGPGGIVVFHDGLLFSTVAAVKYMVGELGYSQVALPNDSTAKVAGRALKYLTSLGAFYARFVIPRMHRSIVALQRPE